jgi:ribose transport system substrate-binding protein
VQPAQCRAPRVGVAVAYRGAMLGLVSAGVLLAAASAFAQQGPGIARPVILPPFDAAAPACSPPPDLEKILAFAQDNERDFMDGVAHGLQMAAKDRGLAYRVSVAADDAAKNAEQVKAFRAARAGGVIAAPVDAFALARDLQEVIWSGAYVGTVVPPPATTILNAPQYLTGKTLAEEAAKYIRDTLKTANVVLLTHDSLEFLAPRFVAFRDVLNTVPGATVVADISPRTVNEQGGYDTMKTVLEAHPDIDVVLGADTVVLGALKALREAKKDRPDQFLGGIDGEPGAVKEIKAGNGPYKTSVSLNSPVFGYALGWFAADWLDGKSVPQAMDILPIALTKENMAQYEADLENPGAVYADAARRHSYLRMYGNICYDTRDRYLNFPWSSERK